MKTIVENEQKKGIFINEKGAVDTRTGDLKDITLANGFQINCGLKGGKLSGGQK